MHTVKIIAAGFALLGVLLFSRAGSSSAAATRSDSP